MIFVRVVGTGKRNDKSERNGTRTMIRKTRITTIIIALWAVAAASMMRSAVARDAGKDSTGDEPETCLVGSTESRACGSCGTQSRVCDVTGTWTEWSACAEAPACTIGETRTVNCGRCGTQELRCVDRCRWHAEPCVAQGPCFPGTTDQRLCGNCGVKLLKCGTDCQWQDAPCVNQGECSPGQVQREACCDCGERQRTCSASCQWEEFSPCQNSEPPPLETDCDTGQPDHCAAGKLQCVDGCKQCVPVDTNHKEVCDDIDNDCDGEIDNDVSSTQTDSRAAYAAVFMEEYYPREIPQGKKAQVSVTFRNVGSQTWRPGEIWLETQGANDSSTGSLTDWDSWPAHNVATTLRSAVEPGQEARFDFTILANSLPQNASQYVETFQLVNGTTGTPLRCPSPVFHVTIAALPPVDGDQGKDASPADGDASTTDSDADAARSGSGATDGSSCTVHPRTRTDGLVQVATLGAGLVLAMAARRRRRTTR